MVPFKFSKFINQDGTYEEPTFQKKIIINGNSVTFTNTATE